MTSVRLVPARAGLLRLLVSAVRRVPASPLDAVGSGSVGDKFGDRSWESNALAGGEPRLVDPLRGGGDHRFLATINVGSFGVPEAAMRFVNILSAARA